MVKEDKFALSNLKGVGPVTIKKLNNVGITDMLNLVIHSHVELAELTGMEKDTAIKTIEKAREILVDEGLLGEDFKNAEEIAEIRANQKKISCGCESLNQLLDGGVETQAITEVYGQFGSGKTQFCHTLAVIAQQSKELGGLDGNVLYIDTENTFRPDRIKTIAQVRGFDVEKAVKGITVAKAINSAHQLLLLQHSSELIKKNNIKLIIVDSVTGLYRAEYLGRGTLADRQQTLNKFIHLLHRMSEVYDVASVVTNQVMSSPGIMFGDPILAIGGHVLAHTSTYRIYFKKSGSKKIARIVDSPSHREAEVLFSLDESGVTDVKEKEK